ncbi:Uncharacterised protein [Mycobacteroides abscessus subsp. abscessus]|nr:Uncharacterised protein [Mycobacteroides abscessus subsp. abscessus]
MMNLPFCLQLFKDLFLVKVRLNIKKILNRFLSHFAFLQGQFKSLVVFLILSIKLFELPIIPIAFKGGFTLLKNIKGILLRYLYIPLETGS